MIELKEDQLQALNGQEQPLILVDPKTGQEYLLIKREVYDQLQGLLKPFREGWDDPKMDVYNELSPDHATR